MWPFECRGLPAIGPLEYLNYEPRRCRQKLPDVVQSV
jgi:hypothetical protein